MLNIIFLVIKIHLNEQFKKSKAYHKKKLKNPNPNKKKTIICQQKYINEIETNYTAKAKTKRKLKENNF